MMSLPDKSISKMGYCIKKDTSDSSKDCIMKCKIFEKKKVLKKNQVKFSEN